MENFAPDSPPNKCNSTMVTAVTNLSITPEESKLFEVLLGSVKWSKRETVLRVAGGWVRDKVLKKPSHDIDIALSDQSGEEFASAVNDYLLNCLGQQTRGIGIIQANPDQSKHLVTATLKVMGFEIDCVNLRTETYSEETRIPTMQMGTAYEDAMRRDFTVNALFYNINSGQVEDFTGKGLYDLQHGIIRTPLPALVTFQDDPLRVLRAIRFSSRYDFSMHPDIQRALVPATSATESLPIPISEFSDFSSSSSSLLSIPPPSPTSVQPLQLLGACDGSRAQRIGSTGGCDDGHSDSSRDHSASLQTNVFVASAVTAAAAAAAVVVVDKDGADSSGDIGETGREGFILAENAVKKGEKKEKEEVKGREKEEQSTRRQQPRRESPIHAALVSKISRERIYKECEGMFSTLPPPPLPGTTTKGGDGVFAKTPNPAVKRGPTFARPCLAFIFMHRLRILDVVLPLDAVLSQCPPSSSASTFHNTTTPLPPFPPSTTGTTPAIAPSSSPLPTANNKTKSTKTGATTTTATVPDSAITANTGVATALSLVRDSVQKTRASIHDSLCAILLINGVNPSANGLKGTDDNNVVPTAGAKGLARESEVNSATEGSIEGDRYNGGDRWTHGLLISAGDHQDWQMLSISTVVWVHVLLKLRELITEEFLTYTTATPTTTPTTTTTAATAAAITAAAPPSDGDGVDGIGPRIASTPPMRMSVSEACRGVGYNSRGSICIPEAVLRTPTHWKHTPRSFVGSDILSSSLGVNVASKTESISVERKQQHVAGEEGLRKEEEGEGCLGSQKMILQDDDNDNDNDRKDEEQVQEEEGENMQWLVKPLLWSAAMSPVAGVTAVEKRSKREVSYIPTILAEALKMENAAVRAVQLMLDGMVKFLEFAAVPDFRDIPIRAAGDLLRQCKELWRASLLLACAHSLSILSLPPPPSFSPSVSPSVSPSLSLSGRRAVEEGKEAERGERCVGEQQQRSSAGREQHRGIKRASPTGSPDSGVSDCATAPPSQGFTQAPVYLPTGHILSDVHIGGASMTIVHRFAALERYLAEDLHLEGVWTLKPLLSGSELIKQLGVPKGPIIGRLIEEQIQWQIRKGPTATASADREACLRYLRAHCL